MSDAIFDLSGKTAIVTGGNGGIGLGIAVGLARAGSGKIINIGSMTSIFGHDLVMPY